MTIRRNALGRGLDSLISVGDVQTAGSSAINEIEVSLIHPNPSQPRTNFDAEALGELAASIRELGVIQPLSLRSMPDGSYQIIACERRWRAAKMAGLLSVLTYVRTASDSEVTEMALIENIQREDLNAIEVALAFRKLIDTYSLTQDRLSERLGKKRATIANHLRLLKLPAEIQLGLRDRKIDRARRRLLAVDDTKTRLRLYNRIIEQGLSVRRVEQLARQYAEGDSAGPSAPKASAASGYESFQRELSNYFPTPVKFSRSESGKGSITLRFDNDDQLQRLVELFEKLK